MRAIFDNPISVWDEAISNLRDEDRYALYVLATMPHHVLYSDWRYAYINFACKTKQELGLCTDEDSWLKMTKRLEQCFIRTKASENELLVSLANPSVFDYLRNHLSNLPDTCRKLIAHAYFAEQIWHLFTDNSEGGKSIAKIEIPLSDYNVVALKFNELVTGNTRCCRLKPHPGNRFTKSDTSIIELFEEFIDNFCSLNKRLGYIVETHLTTDQLIETSTVVDVLSLLCKLTISKCPFDSRQLMEELLFDIHNTYEAYEYIVTAKKIGYTEITNNEYFFHFIDGLAEEDVSNAGDYQSCEELLDNISMISKELEGWDGSEYRKQLKDRQDEIVGDMDCDDDAYNEFKYQMGKAREDFGNMDNLFNCLKS